MYDWLLNGWHGRPGSIPLGVVYQLEDEDDDEDERDLARRVASGEG